MERAKLIQNICNELYLFPNDKLENQRNVILVVILKAMKRGDEAEQAAAVRMATLAVLQSVREERFCCELSNEFLKFLNHSPAAISTNASICTALAFIELANNNELNNSPFLEPLMNLFRQFFCGAQSKQRKTLKENHIDETSAILRTRALEAWGLLLTTCSLDVVYTLVNNKIIEELTVLLMNDLATEFRIVCGQVICLIIELGQLRQSEYFEENMLDTCIVIRNILNDRRSASSTKRKSLNTRLRAVLQYVEVS